MLAGQTEIKVGTKVKLVIEDNDDLSLNGLTGEVTHPFAFGCQDKDWIGIWLDESEDAPRNCNVNISEIEIV